MGMQWTIGGFITDENVTSDRFQFMSEYLAKREIELVNCNFKTYPYLDECITYIISFLDFTGKELQQLIGSQSVSKISYMMSSVTRTVTLSSSPIAQESASMDLIQIDNTVLSLLLVALASCSWFLIFTKDSKFNALTVWLENIWANYGLLFTEPSDNPPISSSGRFAFGSWLILVLIMTIEIGSNLKSSFSVVSYDVIDGFDDLLKSRKIDVLTYENSLIMWKYCEMKANDDGYNEKRRKAYARLCKNAENPKTLTDLTFIPENNRKISKKKTALLTTMMELKTHIRGQFKNIRQSKRLFYLGQKSTVDEMSYFLISANVSNNAFLRELVIKSALVQMETEALAYKRFESKYILDIILWKKPIDTAESLDLENFEVIFKLWLLCICVSCSVLLIEMLSRCTILRRKKPATNWFGKIAVHTIKR